MRIFGSIGYCSSGNHPSEVAWTWAGASWCPQHLPPSSEPDPLEPGYCQWGRGHFARDGVRWLPPRKTVDGRFLCRDHYRDFVLEVVRRGFWRR